MKEKSVSTKTTEPRREAAGTKEKSEQPARAQTRKRVRKIVERHRETFDELAK